MAYKNKETARLRGREWWNNNQDKIIAYREAHRGEQNEYAKQYHKEHREHLNEWARNYRKELKRKVIGHYTGASFKCAHCGFSDIRALQIDHIAGGGEVHRRETKGNTYAWLIKRHFPSGFQVLCANCQRIKMHENHEWANKWAKGE